MFDAPPARGGNRANGERRLDGLAVDVLVALRVRDTTVADAERLVRCGAAGDAPSGRVCRYGIRSSGAAARLASWADSAPRANAGG